MRIYGIYLISGMGFKGTLSQTKNGPFGRVFEAVCVRRGESLDLQVGGYIWLI